MSRGVSTPKIVVAVARELSGFIWSIFRECQQPGCVDIRTPRTIPSPNQAARKVHYILHPVTNQ